MKDQKRWMTNWIRALVVGTLIAGTVPLSVMAAEKGWVNENGAVHFVDSKVLMQRMSGKLPRECPIIWMEKAIWQRIPGSMELTMPGKMAA